jgi:hypothetical protein
MSDLSGVANNTQARFLVGLDNACPTLNPKMWREVEGVLDAHDVRPVVAVIPDNRDPKMMIDEPDRDFWKRVRGCAPAATRSMHVAATRSDRDT